MEETGGGGRASNRVRLDHRSRGATGTAWREGGRRRGGDLRVMKKGMTSKGTRRGRRGVSRAFAWVLVVLLALSMMAYFLMLFPTGTRAG